MLVFTLETAIVLERYGNDYSFIYLNDYIVCFLSQGLRHTNTTPKISLTKRVKC